MKILKNFKSLVLLTVATFTFANAHASFLVDPYMGYNIYGAGTSINGVQTAKYSYTAPNLGLRAGYQMLGLMAGVEYSMASKFSLESELTTTTTTDYAATYLGVFVGYELPILLRAWATYYLAVDFNADADDSKIAGSGLGAGVGFSGLPFVSLNLEVRQISLDKQTSAAGIETTYTGDAISRMVEILFTVSLPLNL